MAPLESALQEAPARPRPVNSLMRALLYVSQQLGRPVSEAELRGLAVLPVGPLDERGLPARRPAPWLRGARGRSRAPRPHELPTAVRRAGVGMDLPMSWLSVDGGQATLLDVVEGRIVTGGRLAAPGLHARLVLRDCRQPMKRRRRWHAPIWSRFRPASPKLAAVSFVVNLLALATPLFMMVVVNRLAGPAD